MLWKILSGVSAVALLLGLWFSFSLKDILKEERAMAARSKQNLADVKQEIVHAEELKGKNEKSLEEANKQREELTTKLEKQSTEIKDKEQEAQTVAGIVENVKKQVVQLEEQIKRAGNIDQLMSQVKGLTEQKTATESAVANATQQIALSDEKVKTVQEQIKRTQDAEARQRRGVVDPTFTARVSQAFPGFGFVILNKGNAGGMFANAMLEVKRGRQVVAKLKVRDVEQAQSVADLIPGSLSPNATVRSGDLVVASKEQAPPPGAAPAAAPGAAPAAPADGSAPATPPAPADPAAAPAMANDPFGAPPAAPAPGAMAPAADPFGAPPAAAAPMAPAAADPFGAPPAAAPTAPPAAAAPGTSAMPSTADPFAPKP